MVETRPDWLDFSSAQLGCAANLVCEQGHGLRVLKDEDVNARICAAVEQGGADAWFTTSR